MSSIEDRLRAVEEKLGNIPARFGNTAPTPGVQLVEVRPPRGSIQPDYQAGVYEQGNPIGYKMAGGGYNARDKFTYSSGSLLSGEVVSGTIQCSGNLYSGLPTVGLFSRFDGPPPLFPAYAFQISNASGTPMEVISSCQETLFVTQNTSGNIGSGQTIVGPINSGQISPGVNNGSPIYSGSNVSCDLAIYPEYGKAGTRVYPCSKAQGTGKAIPDAPSFCPVNVVYNGPWLAPGSTVVAKYCGGYPPDGSPAPGFSWTATGVPFGNPNQSGTGDQYTFEFPVYGVPCSGNTGLACLADPVTSGGLFAVPIKIAGEGDLSSGNYYWAHWAWQDQKFVVCANACCASGQYAASGSLSSG